MARLAPPALKRPARASLRSIGIPDGMDVLAVYIWWSKRQRFRAFVEADISSEIASSVRSVCGEDEEEERDTMLSFTSMAFETRSPTFDLRGVGGQFE